MSQELDVVLWAQGDLRSNPERYQEAIAWWNTNFSARAYRENLARQRRYARTAGLRPSRASLSEWVFLSRLRDAMDSFPKSPPLWRRLSQRDARRMLLLTIMVTRPDFDPTAVGLQGVPTWSEGRLLPGRECFGRDWGDGAFQAWDGKGEGEQENALWMRLAEASRRILTAEHSTAEHSTAQHSAVSSPATTVKLPWLNEAARAAAAYIDRYPGKKGDAVAHAVGISPEHFRRLFPKLRQHGYYNEDGYRPPKS